MRLIDADRFKNWLMENYVLYDGGRSLKDIDAQPTVDAVEVVRCKDCTRYVPFKDVDGVCLAHNKGVLIIMSQNGYCNLGERREDAETN